MARTRREDDDDDYDDERPRRRPARRPKPGGNPAVMIIAILGGVFALVVLVCAGVALYVYTSVARGVSEAQQKMAVEARARQDEAAKAPQNWAADQAKQKEAESNSDKGQATAAGLDFIGLLRDKDYDGALAMMTPALRGRTSAEKLGRQAAANQTVLDWPRIHGLRDLEPFGPKAGTTFRFELFAASGRIPLTLVKQDGRWLVSSVTFPK